MFMKLTEDDLAARLNREHLKDLKERRSCIFIFAVLVYSLFRGSLSFLDDVFLEDGDRQILVTAASRIF
jgi:hypothetical protein